MVTINVHKVFVNLTRLVVNVYGDPKSKGPKDSRKKNDSRWTSYLKPDVDFYNSTYIPPEPSYYN